jgi:branched-subunit amino acid transport protein
MRRPGSLAFSASAIFFAIFATNVVSAAFGFGAFFRDVLEMLALLVAVVFFVAGILAREASERPSRA